MNLINHFVEKLSKEQVSSSTRNIYSEKEINFQIRKENLRKYLTVMKEGSPSILLLGEAPGHKGCGITGIPFTSEKIISEVTFFSSKKFQFINPPDKLESEISASIVWETLIQFENNLPLIWNIYPFHPHKSNNLKSNRPPKAAELKNGLIFLKELIKIFEIKKILAVGRKPESQIGEFDIYKKYIRHPSYGGKKQFIEGLRAEL